MTLLCFNFEIENNATSFPDLSKIKQSMSFVKIYEEHTLLDPVSVLYSWTVLKSLYTCTPLYSWFIPGAWWATLVALLNILVDNKSQ